MTRLGVSLAVFAAVALLVPAVVFRAVDRLEIPAVEVALDAIDVIDEGLVGLQARPPGDGGWHVGFLGDSMLVSYPPKQRVPERLQQVLDASADAEIRIHSLASPGMGAFDYYFVAERIADASPDQVILPVNLSSFSRGWRETFARPELAGFIPPSRLPEAFTLPLDWIGLTADRLLGAVALIQAGTKAPWQALTIEQARLGGSLNRVRGILSNRFGGGAELDFARESFRHHGARIVLPDTQRLTPIGVEERFGKALAGVGPRDPTLQLLAAAIGVFRSRGIEVLVYTNPTNVEHFSAVGSDTAGLEKTIASIGVAATQSGARFIDLHALLSDAGFRDFGGHMKSGGEVDGPLLLARRLAPLLAERVRSVAPSRSSRGDGS